MRVRLIRARHGQEVGDVAEVPDGAAVSDLYYEIVEPPAPPPAPAPAAAAAPKAGA